MKLIIVLFILFIIILNKSNFTNKTCLNVNVDKFFILTTDTNGGRYKNFISSFNKQKFNKPLEVVKGVDTRNPEVGKLYKHLVTDEKYKYMYDFDKGKNRPDHTYFNSGALGCYLGHIDIYKKAIEQNLDYIVIFEDNVTFNANFKNELNNVLKSVPADFDAIFFHHWYYHSDKIIKCDKKIDKLHFINSTKCYLINVKSIKKYFDLFFPIENHIDGNYEKLIYHGANVYLIKLNNLKINIFGGSLINHTSVINNGKRFLYFTEFNT